MTLLPLPSFGIYSKLVNGAIGLAVGAALSYAATKGLGTCVPTADGLDQACTVAGFSQADVTSAIVSLIGLLFIHQSPPNVPKP